MERDWNGLPRGWLMANLEMCRAHELKAFVLETVQWGFDEPDDLTNNAKRIRWLLDCREKAWTMVSRGGAVPTPGKAIPDEERKKRSPARPRKLRTKRFPAFASSGSDQEDPILFSENYVGRSTAKPRQARVRADLCKISAADVNAWLRTLPLSGEAVEIGSFRRG